ncbi:hypothetical protein AgCh_004323 [Apium graveolens]
MGGQYIFPGNNSYAQGTEFITDNSSEVNVLYDRLFAVSSAHCTALPQEAPQQGYSLGNPGYSTSFTGSLNNLTGIIASSLDTDYSHIYPDFKSAASGNSHFSVFQSNISSNVSQNGCPSEISGVGQFNQEQLRGSNNGVGAQSNFPGNNSYAQGTEFITDNSSEVNVLYDRLFAVSSAHSTALPQEAAQQGYSLANPGYSASFTGSLNNSRGTIASSLDIDYSHIYPDFRSAASGNSHFSVFQSNISSNVSQNGCPSEISGVGQFNQEQLRGSNNGAGGQSNFPGNNSYAQGTEFITDNSSEVNVFYDRIFAISSAHSTALPQEASQESLFVNTHTVKDPNTVMSDTETPTKPTKTEEPPKTQIQSRYETIRVPILRPSEYPIWKVRMTMFLEPTDPEYLDRIKEGPHKPTKFAVAIAGEAAKTVPKEKSDYTAEDIASIAKDAKMSGTDIIKKNRKTILTQEYEHFDSKTNESLNDLYDRFVKLLNDLSLVDKEYDLEDSNLKFLLALPECWDLKATTIRDNYNLDETTLDEIYVALKAEEESPKAASSKKDKGKALFIKSDTESSSSENDDDSDSESLPEIDADEEMMKLCALMVKGITKIAYRKFRKGKKFSRKGISHISPDCKKVKGDKGKALVTKQKSWTDTSDSESEENYVLMANADKSSAESSSEAAETKGNRKNILVLDSGCSGHMTGNKALLSDFVEKAGPSVSYGDGNIGKTLGYGNINLGNVIIKEVALVLGLKHNLLSISQICDRGYHVDFFEEHCEIVSKSKGKVVLKGYRRGNIYEAKLSTSTDGSAICLMSRASIEESWNWHKKLSHLNFNNINELVKKDLVRGLPKTVFALDGLCDSCQKAKQIKSSFKSKTESSILEPYHLLHVDLFGPVNVMSIAKKKYALVIVDEFTRYTWVYFLHTKNETASILIDHVKQLDKMVKDSVKILRSDNGTEFKNLIMEEFCKNHGIKQEFSAPGTPQQNGVVERKNRTLIEAARTMLEEAKLPTYFWAEGVQTACFTQNATLINKH